MNTLLWIKVAIELRKEGDIWECKTASGFRVRNNCPLAARHTVEQAERQKALSMIYSHGLTGVVENSSKYGLTEVVVIDPQDEREHELTIPLFIQEEKALVFVRARSRSYINGSTWSYLACGLPVIGIGYLPLEAHQNCENALMNHVKLLLDERGFQRALYNNDDISYQVADSFHIKGDIISFPILETVLR